MEDSTVSESAANHSRAQEPPPPESAGQPPNSPFESHDLLGIIGFAIYLSWVYLMLSNSMLLPGNVATTGVATIVVYFIMGQVIASLLVWVFAKHLASSTAIKILVIFAIFLTPIPGLCSLFIEISEPFLAFAWFFAGFGAVFLVALWGGFLSKFDHKSAVLYPPIAMLISAVIVLLALCFTKTEAVKFMIATLPWISVVLYLIVELGSIGGKRGTFLNPDYSSTKPPNAKALIRSSCAIFSNCILLGIVFFIVSVTRAEIIVGAVCFSMLIAAIFKVFDAKHHQRFEVSEVIKVLAPTAALGLLPLPFVGLDWRVACVVLMVFVGIVTETVVWTAVCEYTRVNKIMPFANMAFGRLGNLIGLEIGFLLAGQVFSSSLEGELSNPWILSAIVIVIVILQSFLFKDNYSPFAGLQNIDDDLDKTKLTIAQGGRWRKKCECFVDSYRLTPRQKEVLFLLAKGYSTSYIEETLTVSDHTIKAHIYNIYRKANVHTRQELIELIEEYNIPDDFDNEQCDSSQSHS